MPVSKFTLLYVILFSWNIIRSFPIFLSIELKVTKHSTETREIDYTLKAVDYDKTLNYKDLLLETIPALPRLLNQPDSELRPKLKDENQAGNLQLPPELSYIFKVNDHKDDIPSIVWVLAGRSMFSSVLDAYLTLKLDDFKRTAILQSNNQMKRTFASQRFQYLPLEFLLIFDQFEADRRNGIVCNFFQVESLVKKFYPKYRINKDTILISPICAKKHFYLAIFYFKYEVILIFDSCWKHFPNSIRLKNVRDVLRYLLIGNPNLCQKPEKWEIKFVDHCAQQTDDYNCGCYVIKFIEYQLNGKGLSEKCYQKVFSKEEIVEIRRNIVRKLLPTTKVGSQLLEVITE